MPLPQSSHQTPKTKVIDRKDHVWLQRRLGHGVLWKCLLCGAITHSPPPDYPTPADWLPERWQPLAPAERDLLPYCQHG